MSAQYSFLAGTYCTSKCHGTRPGTTRFTGSGGPHARPSVERRWFTSTSDANALQPDLVALTDHMRQELASSRTTAGEISPHFSPVNTRFGSDHRTPSPLVMRKSRSSALVV